MVWPRYPILDADWYISKKYLNGPISISYLVVVCCSNCTTIIATFSFKHFYYSSTETVSVSAANCRYILSLPEHAAYVKDFVCREKLRVGCVVVDECHPVTEWWVDHSSARLKMLIFNCIPATDCPFKSVTVHRSPALLCLSGNSSCWHTIGMINSPLLLLISVFNILVLWVMWPDLWSYHESAGPKPG